MKTFKMAVAVDHPHGFKPFVRPPRCRLQSYSHLDFAMLELTQTTLTRSIKHAYHELTTRNHNNNNIHRSFSTPCLSLSTGVEEELDTSTTNPRIEIISGHKAPRVHALVAEVAIALASGIKPEPVLSGLGGAYFLHSRNGRTIAVVKPADEEPLAFNNPKGFAGRMLGQPGIKRSIRVGETGLRELAAYLLDHGGFAGVPPSAVVKISHVSFHHATNIDLSESDQSFKITSLQHFVEHDSDAGDLGPSSFSVGSVHRIAILDIRLLNLDRHAGNILVKKGNDSYASGVAELIPIDHGLCLPESLDDPYFEWLHWPQASIPFSDIEVDYISNLDPFKDADLLRTELHASIRESSLRVLILCTIFLKQAAAAGLTLADIGEMMTRELSGGEENWSTLEEICLNAKGILGSEMSTYSDNKDTDGNFEAEQEEGEGEEEEEDNEIFQFDQEFEECFSKTKDAPELLETKNTTPAKILRFSSEGAMAFPDSVILSPLNMNGRDDHALNSTTVHTVEENEGSSFDNLKNGALSRSMSFAVHNNTLDSGCISFEEMKEDEWETFLEIFEELLPVAFEERKGMGLLKQRLGTSCEF